MKEGLPIIDLEQGAKLISSDNKAAKQMIGDLILLLPEELSKLHQAFTHQDTQKIHDIAHYLHGGACFCGAPRFKEVIKELEIKSRKYQDIQELTITYQQLLEEVDAIMAAYQEIEEMNG